VYNQVIYYKSCLQQCCFRPKKKKNTCSSANPILTLVFNVYQEYPKICIAIFGKALSDPCPIYNLGKNFIKKIIKMYITIVQLMRTLNLIWPFTNDNDSIPKTLYTSKKIHHAYYYQWFVNFPFDLYNMIIFFIKQHAWHTNIIVNFYGKLY
jgi:hypothetical protein